MRYNMRSRNLYRCALKCALRPSPYVQSRAHLQDRVQFQDWTSKALPMPKRARRPAPESTIHRTDLAGTGRSADAEASRILSVRVTAFHWRLWTQLRQELGLSVADLGRRALLVAAAVVLRDKGGARPEVYWVRANGERVQVAEFLGLSDQAPEISHQDLRGAARPTSDESYGITLRVYGDFWTRLLDRLLQELSCSPSELLRRSLALLASTTLKDADGTRPVVWIRTPGAAEAEPLNAFLGIEDILTTAKTSLQDDVK